MRPIDLRVLLGIEAVAFAAAALVHFGVGVTGYEDRAAGTAEAIIGVVLAAGAILGWLQPGAARAAALATQGFALVGSLVGLALNLFVGPTTPPDIAFHAGIVIALAWGLTVAWRTDSGTSMAA